MIRKISKSDIINNYILNFTGTIQDSRLFVGIVRIYNLPLNIIYKRSYSTSETIRNKNQTTKISEHRPNKKSLDDLSDKEFGYYLAGLIDADGYIGRDRITITYCLNDKSFAHTLRDKLGYGSIYKVKGENTISYAVFNKEGTSKILNLINGKLRLIAKIEQFKIIVESKKLNIKVKDVDTSLPLTKTYWFSGFSDGDSCFYIQLKDKNMKYQGLHFDINLQTRDKYLLEQMKKTFNEGYFGPKKTRNSYIFKSSSLLCNYKIIKYFDQFQLQTSKYINFLYWRKAYLLVQDKLHLTEDGLNKIKKYKGRMNTKSDGTYHEDDFKK